MKHVSLSEAMNRCASPQRICLAVMLDSRGIPDIITLGWKMWTSAQPPMIAISIGQERYSHEILPSCGEFVLAWPGEDLSEGVLYCGTKSGREVSKFNAIQWTPLPALKVKPPLIKECIVNLECKVVGSLGTGDHTIFVGEVLAGHVSEDDRRLLISVGNESGYDSLGGSGGYRFGAIKR